MCEHISMKQPSSLIQDNQCFLLFFDTRTLRVCFDVTRICHHYPNCCPNNQERSAMWCHQTTIRFGAPIDAKRTMTRIRKRIRKKLIKKTTANFDEKNNETRAHTNMNCKHRIDTLTGRLRSTRRDPPTLAYKLYMCTHIQTKETFKTVADKAVATTSTRPHLIYRRSSLRSDRHQYKPFFCCFQHTLQRNTTVPCIHEMG